MVENPIVGSKFRPFYMYNFISSLQYFHTISLVDCLATWNEFKLNNAIRIEGSVEHCLHL
jgi:hypothetical protein